ncbi:MAG: CBS domain-containing protein [Bacilli bacterium]|nr:CBS domain-containing protein [Bacilli bacterium]
MNIFLFLKPKSEVEYLISDMSVRQAMEKMEYHRYTNIPVISKDGKFTGSISEGDILWYLKNNGINTLKQAETISINEVSRYREYKAMGIDYEMEDLIDLAVAQNFVPIVDSDGVFIGIVTRKDIINHLYKDLKEKK